MALVFSSKTRDLRVVKNEDGTITLYQADGSLHPNPGRFILSMGGIAAVLRRCVETDWEAAIASRAAEEARKEEKRQEKANQLYAEHEEARKKCEALKGTAVEATLENIQLILKALYSMPGIGYVSHLPFIKNIPYTAINYDCDGQRVATVKLDKPVGGYKKLYYCCGAKKRGHLERYTSIGTAIYEERWGKG